MSEQNPINNKDFWDVLRIISISLGAVAVPIVIAIFGHTVNISIKERDIRLRMVELSFEILKEDPSKKSTQTDVIREWAMDVVDAYSEIKLPKNARQTLRKNPLLGVGIGSCWTTVTEDGRVTEDLYNITMFDESFLVQFAAPPNRKIEAASFQAPAISSSMTVSMEEFGETFKSVFNYSKNNT